MFPQASEINELLSWFILFYYETIKWSLNRRLKQGVWVMKDKEMEETEDSLTLGRGKRRRFIDELPSLLSESIKQEIQTRPINECCVLWNDKSRGRQDLWMCVGTMKD